MTSAEQHALFDRWMADHPGILHRVANASADGADRSDLLQELMLAVWKAVPAFKGGSKASTFIYRVPLGGTESMATPAAPRPFSRRSCVVIPPNEWPMMIGGPGKARMMAL